MLSEFEIDFFRLIFTLIRYIYISSIVKKMTSALIYQSLVFTWNHCICGGTSYDATDIVFFRTM